MYIVLLTTSGAASCPRRIPVSKVHARWRFLTLAVVISFRPLKRVLAKFLAGISHWPSSLCCAGGPPLVRPAGGVCTGAAGACPRSLGVFVPEHATTAISVAHSSARRLMFKLASTQPRDIGLPINRR